MYDQGYDPLNPEEASGSGIHFGGDASEILKMFLNFVRKKYRIYYIECIRNICKECFKYHKSHNFYFISENVPLSSGIKKPLNTILPRTYTRRKVLSSKPTLIRLSATLISNNVHCSRLKMSTCLISLILKIRNRLTRGL